MAEKTASKAIRGRELSQEEKIAVLVASLDKSVAASILQQLEPAVMLRVVNTVKKLGVVPGPVRDRAISECLEGIRELGNAIQGDEKTVNALLTSAVGEKRAAALLAETKEESHHDAFASVAQLRADQIVGFLSREQPGIIALVLRYIPADLAAEVLEILPSETRRRVIVFMSTAEPPSEEVVARVEVLLNEKAGPTRRAKKSSTADADKLDVVTGIIQHAKGSVEEDLLGAIEEKSEALANAIRDRLFTFEDIVRLSDQALRRAMQEIDMGVLAIALRNSDEELRMKFFSNMSKRAAEGLQEEMEYAQKVRLTDVEAKQREIVNTIRALEAQGQIAVGGEDEYV